MKIIAKDNLDRDTVSDVLIASEIENESYAKTMVEAMNEHHTEKSFFAVPDDHKLYTFEP